MVPGRTKTKYDKTKQKERKSKQNKWEGNNCINEIQNDIKKTLLHTKTRHRSFTKMRFVFKQGRPSVRGSSCKSRKDRLHFQFQVLDHNTAVTHVLLLLTATSPYCSIFSDVLLTCFSYSWQLLNYCCRRKGSSISHPRCLTQ